MKCRLGKYWEFGEDGNDDFPSQEIDGECPKEVSSDGWHDSKIIVYGHDCKEVAKRIVDFLNGEQ